MTGRTGFQLDAIRDAAFALISWALLSLLLVQFDIVPWLWSLLQRFRGRTAAFAISVLFEETTDALF